MKLIIAGGRNISIWQFHNAIKKSKFVQAALKNKAVIISGGASGVDRFAETFAIENSLQNDVYLADWDNTDSATVMGGLSIKKRFDGTEYNKMAGINRNVEMAKNGTHLLLIWDGKSRGSQNMLSEAMLRGLDIEQAIFKDGSILMEYIKYNG